MPELSISQSVMFFALVGALALLYSSVGHGGATGYLAAAALVGVSPAISRPGALWLNCCVAGIAFWRFQRAGFFSWPVFLPLAVASVPCAWIGSRIHLEGRTYAAVLGLALLAAGWFLGWGRKGETTEPIRSPALWVAMAAGAFLGLLAGLTGIGGGVFLTPLIIFLNWTAAKTASGISALFIVVNSISGLVGLGASAIAWRPVFIVPVVLGIVGALAGTYMGVHKWRTTAFRRVLASVLWIAAAKLFITAR